ncbi:MAG: succinyl-diaminopimelate desuccinylase [Actinomycetia bacterium]|nr:succinyl-diaminopimelate desuccinylase [Actinomycetes bacterium]
MDLPPVVSTPETADAEDVGGDGNRPNDQPDDGADPGGQADQGCHEGEDDVGQDTADARDQDRAAETPLGFVDCGFLAGVGGGHSLTLSLLGSTRPIGRLRFGPVTGDDLLNLTATMVNTPSESFAEGPFVDWLHHQLEGLAHLQVTRVGDNLVARTTLGRGRRLILAGHSDTVPANGNATARIEGDLLWGLGSADMKGGLAVFLSLARQVVEPAIDLTYIIYAREEVAREHSGLTELARARPDLVAGDCAILGEPTSAMVEAGCQGALRFELHLAGVRAHTARPWMGRNAVHRLAPVLTALSGYQARMPIIDGCEYRESLQAVGVEAGVAGNVVPDAAVLGIHHRFAPDRSPAEAEASVRDLLAPHLDEGDEVSVVDSAPACPPSLTHPLLERLVDENQLEVGAKLGWTDVAQLAELGIPATNFGPGDAAVAHSAGEFLDRTSLEQCHGALRRLITTA